MRIQRRIINGCRVEFWRAGTYFVSSIAGDAMVIRAGNAWAIYPLPPADTYEGISVYPPMPAQPLRVVITRAGIDERIHPAQRARTLTIAAGLVDAR